MIKAEFYSKDKDDKVRCLLCPKLCLIAEHFSGKCKVRQNIKGELYAKSYFEAASVNIDPIEKKPLYHFHPGRQIFSLGAGGCNMRCSFCQNFQISQNSISEIPISAEEIIRLSKENNSVGVAYTYTEPTVWYEFAYVMSEEAKKAGLKNVFVTNGNINPKPLEKILPLMDAANVDIKAFTQEQYDTMNGSLDAVMNTINMLYHASIHTEISSLIVPNLWNENTFEEMCAWLGDTNKLTPLHINRYFPAYKSEIPATPIATLMHFKSIAKKYLKYVYIGNAEIEGASDTVCHTCGKLLIKRSGYNVELFITEPKCPECNTNLHIILS